MAASTEETPWEILNREWEQQVAEEGWKIVADPTVRCENCHHSTRVCYKADDGRVRCYFCTVVK